MPFQSKFERKISADDTYKKMELGKVFQIIGYTDF